jgi:uncharacterized protein (TIGR00251 family)
MDYVISVKGSTGLRIIVQPKAKKTEIIGLYDGMVKLAVASVPVDGKANATVVSFLAKLFNLKKNEIHLVSGARSRRKVCILGKLEETEVRCRLKPFLDVDNMS